MHFCSRSIRRAKIEIRRRWKSIDGSRAFYLIRRVLDPKSLQLIKDEIKKALTVTSSENNATVNLTEKLFRKIARNLRTLYPCNRFKEGGTVGMRTLSGYSIPNSRTQRHDRHYGAFKHRLEV
jgi:hypothetical protein